MKKQEKKDQKQEEKKDRKPRQNFFGQSDSQYIQRKLAKQGFIKGTKLG